MRHGPFAGTPAPGADDHTPATGSLWHYAAGPLTITTAPTPSDRNTCRRLPLNHAADENIRDKVVENSFD